MTFRIILVVFISSFSVIFADIPDNGPVFELTSQKATLSESTIEIRLGYLSSSPMTIHWKKIVSVDDEDEDVLQYWVPITAATETAKFTTTEKITEDGMHEGVTTLKVMDPDSFTRKFVVAFYNDVGNLLFEYFPAIDKDAFRKSEEDGEVYVAEQKTFKTAKVIKNPPLRQELHTGEHLVSECKFLVNKDFDAKVEWIKVNYEQPRQESVFVVRRVSNLKSDRDWVVDKAADYKSMDIDTHIEPQENGMVMISSTMTLDPAKEDHEGVYTCHLFDDFDDPSTFVSSYYELLPHKTEASFHHRKDVYLKFFLCENVFQPVPLTEVTLKSGVPNCFSCGGYSYPRPNVTLMHDNKPVPVDDKRVLLMNLGLDIQVMMYVLDNPSSSDAGRYSCSAQSHDKTATWEFNVSVNDKDEMEKQESKKQIAEKEAINQV